MTSVKHNVSIWCREGYDQSVRELPLSYLPIKDLLAFRLSWKEARDTVDNMVQAQWERCKTLSIPKTISYSLQQVMFSIERHHSQEITIHLFQLLFENLHTENIIKTTYTATEFKDQLIPAIQNIETKALVAMWQKIQAQLHLANPPQTAEEIRAWMNDDANAAQLNQITHLDLRFLELQILPQEIQKLIQLETLNLCNNKFTSIPKELGNLAQLEKLNLSYNQLGSVPQELGNLTQLKELNLSHNQLGSVPQELGNLAQLKELNLSYNQLGSVPQELWNLTQLKTLDLSHNQLTAVPEELWNLTQLETLDLSHNQLTAVPEELWNLTQLETLYLSDNKLTAVPKDLGSLNQLQSLALTNNQLTAVPETFENLTSLEYLSFHDNPLMFIPAAVLNNLIFASDETIKQVREERSFAASSPLAKLYQAILEQKQVEDIQKMFPSLSQAEKRLVYEMVWNCTGRPDTKDRHWGEHHVFDDMNIFYRAVRLAIVTKYDRMNYKEKCALAKRVDILAKNPPKDDLYRYNLGYEEKRFALSNLSRLADAMDYSTPLMTIWQKIQAQLHLANPPQTAEEIRTWMNDDTNAAQLNQITDLDLRRLNLQFLPQEIQKLTQLKILNLSNNKFTFIPKELGKLTQLKELYLANNNLISLSADLVKLSNLRVLELFGNKLTSVPKELGNLTQLQTLSFSFNQLTFVPQELESLNQLEELYLDNNQLPAVPKELGNLAQLRELYLFNNQLTAVPETFENLTSLEYLSFHDNPLMFIPAAVLNNLIFASDKTIKQVLEERSFAASFPLAKLYQAILEQKQVEDIQKMFPSLSQAEKRLVYEMVFNCAMHWNCTGRPSTIDLQWGEHHVFDDMNIFYRAVRLAIVTKYDRMNNEEKFAVVKRVCTPVKNQLTKDLRRYALSNLSRLADVMDPMSQPLVAIWQKIQA